MSNNTERKESETLNDLKGRLWAKIQILDAKLRSIDENSDEYRKALDAYHKIVKSYLDIVKVQRYAPGNLIVQSEDDIVKLFNKIKSKESLGASDKVALQEFKEFLDYVNKVSLSLQKEGE